MRSTIRRLAFLVLVSAFLVPAGCRRGTTGHRRFRLGGGATPVDPGEPVLDPAPGYAGSAVCRDCHRELFDDWAETFHNVSIRKTDREGAAGAAVVADADGNGRDDFRDGLDLGGDPDFAAFGGNAPKLSHAAGEEFPYRVTIGAATFPVWRTIGGNGFWRQRYLTRIGSSVFVLPIQYNEATRDWVPYVPETWYDGTGAPRFADAEAAGIDPAASFDLLCAACHSTGFTVEFDAAAGRYVNGYRELTVGCEDCHGPGRAHVDAGGDASLILNPEDLLDGSPEGLLAADLVCGRCHVQAEGDVPAGGADHAGYPWLTGGSTFPPGSTDLAAYGWIRTEAEKYWLRRDNPLGFSPTPDDPDDDLFLAAREAEMQFVDKGNGVHAAGVPLAPTCFTCHDPHERVQRHQTRNSIEHGSDTFAGVSQMNNGLCLACHRGRGDFAGVSPADVAAITDTGAPDAVAQAVADHMKNAAAMPAPASAYDPAGTGTGRCTLCHMPLVGRSAVFTADRAGNRQGDMHSHNFEAVWPNASTLTDPAMTNSCHACHPLAPGDPAGEIIDEWTGDPDGDGSFHADLPRNFQNGVVNPGRNGGVACVACHTTEGFLEVQVEGTDLHALTASGDAGRREEILRDSLRRSMGLTCRACHGKGRSGGFASGDNPLRLPKAELCGSCHNNRTVLFEDYRDAGETVRHPQREMLAGHGGAEVSGAAYGNGVHTLVTGGDCTVCHLSGADRKHDFMPTLAACRTCHPSLDTFDRAAADDFDGDGTVEGFQTEVEGALARLEEAILAAPASTGAVITFDGTDWLIDGDREATDHLDPAADAALLRAMFNHTWVRSDGSRGIHNPTYALQLLQRSFEELTGTAWPGAAR